ncbi:restriction endonuclease [Domibacillus sp. A3M-37]|uniref:restriction endonuclease n=1 Tax=Domibacillus sp. A3M-37 TaxID=2962037 RepID=UPI0020B8BF6B|nr:restriction endonuclease [Domibacillus sp. A3M-37]MCP3764043.1 restriction endonuclease [Domibacillus sp. A3M-37]
MAKRKHQRKTNVLFNQPLFGSLVLLLVLRSAFEYPLAAGVVLLIIVTLAAMIFYFQWKKRHVKRKKLLQSRITEIDAMTGIEFENYLGVLFEAMGYEVEMTPSSGDYGADLLITKEKELITVQAKRYSKAVGISSIQEVFSAKMYYQASEAWVVTNNTFSRNASELAKKSGVKLIAREQLINLITENIVDTPPPVFTIHTWNEN